MCIYIYMLLYMILYIYILSVCVSGHTQTHCGITYEIPSQPLQAQDIRVMRRQAETQPVLPSAELQVSQQRLGCFISRRVFKQRVRHGYMMVYGYSHLEPFFFFFRSISNFSIFCLFLRDEKSPNDFKIVFFWDLTLKNSRTPSQPWFTYSPELMFTGKCSGPLQFILKKQKGFRFSGFPKKGPSDPLTTPPLFLQFLDLSNPRSCQYNPPCQSLPAVQSPWHGSRTWCCGAAGPKVGSAFHGDFWFCPKYSRSRFVGDDTTTTFTLTNHYLRLLWTKKMPSRDHFSISFVGAGILLQQSLVPSKA